MLFFALTLALGIIIAEACYGLSVWAFLSLLFVFLLSFALVLAFKKSRKLFYVPLALIVGFVAMSATNLQYNSIKLNNYSGEITAKVNSEIVYSGKYYSFDAAEIYVDGNMIILKKYEPACIFCGDAKNVTNYKGRNICASCIKALKSL